MKPTQCIRLIKDLLENDYVASMAGMGRPHEELIEEIRICLEVFDAERPFDVSVGDSQ